MAITPQPLFQITVPTTVAYQLHQPTGTMRLESIIFLNRDVAARTISLYHDIDGAEFVDGTLILKDQSIAAGDRYVFSEPLLLDANGSLGIEVETVDVINVVGYGWADI